MEAVSLSGAFQLRSKLDFKLFVKNWLDTQQSFDPLCVNT